MPTRISYRGRLSPRGPEVDRIEYDDAHGVSSALLPVRLNLRNHSPDGFSWGYHGSGPAQLALAILADALGDDARALELYQSFKAKVIARLDIDKPWSLTTIDVCAAIREIEATRQGGVK